MEETQTVRLPVAATTSIREKIKEIAKLSKLLTDEIKKWEANTPDQDKGEMIANSILCYRHLEDASMRLWKVIQAHDGWVSIYSPSAVGS